MNRAPVTEGLRVSTCCKAPVKVAGVGMTHWHECQKCGAPCDVTFMQPKGRRCLDSESRT